MKKLFTPIVFCSVFAYSSCSSTDCFEPEIDNPISRSIQNDESDDAMLYFESMEAFEEAVANISELSTEEEKAQWVRDRYPNFQSIQDTYWQAMVEMGEIEDVDAQRYNEFEQKYSSLYFPKYMEDAGFYIPMSNLEAAFLVNNNCNVSIANEVVKLKDIEAYSQLVELGRALYSVEKTMPMAAMTNFTLTGDVDPVGQEYDSHWTEYGDRKVKLKARRKINKKSVSYGFQEFNSNLHVEFCFRKKTWLGWSNYSSTSTIVIKSTIPGLGIWGPKTLKNSGTSSHDSELEYPIKVSNDGINWYYTYFETPFEATVDFRGVDHQLKYNWTMIGAQCVTSLSAGERKITPSY